MLDPEQQEEIEDYFMNGRKGGHPRCDGAFGGDYEEDELRLMRIKFISEVAN